MSIFAKKSVRKETMIRKKPAPEPPTREEIFKEKGKSYVPCYSSSCPMRSHCLHAILRPYALSSSPTIRTINLAFEGAETEKCLMYRSSEPVSMAVGLSTIYHDMPGWMEREIKNNLINKYSRKRYYEYHNGTRPFPPAEEAFLRGYLKSLGWAQEPQFHGRMEAFEW